MNINSQFSYSPLQPDNPSDSDRYFLEQYALTQKGRPEDFYFIKRLMSPPPAITNVARQGEFKGLKVGIIGGGLAGLSAAFELRKLGFDITIYEALDDRVGGRVYTYYADRQKQLYHELGAMRIPVSHETVWHYLNLFNLPTRPFIQYNPNAYAYLKNTRVRNDPDGYNIMKYIYPKYNIPQREMTLSWQELLSIGIESHLHTATPMERSEIIQVKPNYSKKALLWSDQTSISMMQSAGLSQEAINILSSLQPVLGGNLYNSFIDYVQESYPAYTDFVYEIQGGFSRLPEKFFNSFNNPNPYPGIAAATLGKVTFHGGCQVDGIHLCIDENKVELRYQYLKSRQIMKDKFDYIVCAIPFSTLRTVDIFPLFSNMKMRAIREVNYISAHKTLLVCKERFWEKDGIVGGGSYTDLPISSIWYPSDHTKYLSNPNNFAKDFKNIPWYEPAVYVASYNFSLDATRLTNQSNEKILEEIIKENTSVHGLSGDYLEKIIEGYKIFNWEKQPTFRGALCFFSPEQKKIFSYAMTLPEYGGKVFFAGEHISAVHRWMQGALQTGMQAANDLALAGKKGRTAYL